MTEHMYPYCKSQSEIDEMIPPTPGTGGIGENLVYGLMKKYLPETWHVLWHRHVDDGYKHEIDFLALRCFQRLSFPDVATQRCLYRDNWNTRGQSFPVLSY